MTNTSILIGLAILYAVSAAMAFYWGFTYAQTKYQLTDITKYLHEKFPDKWAAYKQGAREGYEQGLRDGQENLK